MLLSPASLALVWLGTGVGQGSEAGWVQAPARPGPAPPSHAEPRLHIARSAEHIPAAPPSLHVPPGH